jgi:hypothetical protein
VEMWRTSSANSKTRISRYECPNNSQHASKHVDIQACLLYRLDISRATRAAHTENY